MTREVRKRRKGYTRISPKHQVTIPADVMRKAGLKAGDELRVEMGRDGAVRLVREVDPLDEFAGALDGVYEDGWLDGLRDEWER